ncbi:MAG: hypothetical protein KF729_34320 [Sandaracinaceae bacterium]|nr:hypothetical protein [Sandaracinaceae bacterium]
MAERRGSERLVEGLAGFAITFVLDVLLGVVGLLAVRGRSDMIPPELMLAGFAWLLQLVHVIPSMIVALALRRPWAAGGMAVGALACCAPSLVAFSMVLAAGSI